MSTPLRLLKIGKLIGETDFNIDNETSFDFDFGEVMVRVEKIDGEWRVTNAMDGYGNNCRDQYKNEPVKFFVEELPPLTTKP